MILGHYEISNGNKACVLLEGDTVAMTVYKDEKMLFFIWYSTWKNVITVEKMGKEGITKQKVSKKDREYYSNIMKNFILANTDFPIDNE